MSYILTDEQIGVLEALAVLDMVDTVKTIKMLIASHTALRAERDELQSRCEVLEAALQPFAKTASVALSIQQFPDDRTWIRTNDVDIRYGDLRSAAEALAASQQPDGGEA
jgi:hypothetical protein